MRCCSATSHALTDYKFLTYDFTYESSKCSGEPVQMHSLARVVAARKHNLGTCMKGFIYVNNSIRQEALLDNCVMYVY